MDDSANELSPGFGGAPAPETPSESGALPAPSLPPPSSPMIQHLGSAQDQAAARYGKMKEAVGKLATVRKELDGLVALGDTVSQEDVVKAASGLVAAGLGAPQVAGLLADMPDSGEALQAWIAQHDTAVAGREAQAARALELTRHEMGLAALRHIIGHSAEAPPVAPPSQLSPSSLSPSPPSQLSLEPPNAG